MVFKMEIIKTIRIKSSPDNIFNLYQDIKSWLVWDPEVSSVDIPNGLTIGAKGILKPKKGPKTSIEITEVTQGKSFTVSSKLPLCHMLFKHELVKDDEGTIVIHSVTFSGPFQFLFKYLIGKSIQKSLPSTLCSLKSFIEGK